MKRYKCTKCCNFGPGDPCIITMDRDCPSPTFCPSDDGKYPSADWVDVTEPTDSADMENECSDEQPILLDYVNLIKIGR